MEYVFIVVAMLNGNSFTMIEAKPRMEGKACMDLMVEYNRNPTEHKTFAICTVFTEEEQYDG